MKKITILALIGAMALGACKKSGSSSLEKRKAKQERTKKKKGATTCPWKDC